MQLKASLAVRQYGLGRTLSLGVYHELRSVHRGAGHLGPGNSVTSLLFGRDDGEYYTAIGAAASVSAPPGGPPWWEVRVFAERHRETDKHIDFTVVNAGDRSWRFPQNVEAAEGDELGAEIFWRLRRKPDPQASGWSVQTHVLGAVGDLDYLRVGVLLDATLPLLPNQLRVRARVRGGESWGELPPQRNWFLGGAASVRGFDSSTLVGPSVVVGRLALQGVLPAITVEAFADAGWAGGGLEGFDADEALVAVGLGLGLVGEVIRLNVARGLTGSEQTRWDLYLDPGG